VACHWAPRASPSLCLAHPNQIETKITARLTNYVAQTVIVFVFLVVFIRSLCNADGSAYSLLAVQKARRV
jgi:hypothetical protein